MKFLKKFKKSEQGSVTIFVLSTLLVVLLTMIVIYGSMTNKLSSQAKQVSKIQEEYSSQNSNDEMDEKYYEITGDSNEGNGKQYTVTYNYVENGGSSTTKATDKIQSGALIDLSPIATKQGYEFVGWNTDKNATSKIENLNMGTSDITLYAIYSKTLTATFNYYNGRNTDTNNKSVVIYNKNTSGNITVPTIGNVSISGEIYYPRGWSTQTSGNAEIELQSNTTINISENKTYYASYSKIVTVSYDANGGMNVPANQTGMAYMNYSGQKTGATITISNEVPSKQGYKFTNWSASDGKYYEPSSVININNDIKLTATWMMSAQFFFTIDGTTYGLDSGMNWNSWVNSSYNTDGWVIAPNGNVMNSSYTKTVCDPSSNSPVNAYNNIQRYVNYVTR